MSNGNDGNGDGDGDGDGLSHCATALPIAGVALTAPTVAKSGSIQLYFDPPPLPRSLYLA
jgi:hypothetical protein